MNTSILSSYCTTPTADQLPQPPGPRSAKSADDVDGSNDVSKDKPDDVSDDRNKADAFAEMLAALMGVSTNTAIPTQPITGGTSVAGSATGTAADVPRDGAGAPLFASMTGVADASTAGAAAGGKAVKGSVVGDSALSELAKVGSVTGDTAMPADRKGAVGAESAKAEAIAPSTPADVTGLHVVGMTVGGASATSADRKAAIADQQPADRSMSEIVAASESKSVADAAQQSAPGTKAGAVSGQGETGSAGKVTGQQDVQTLKQGTDETAASDVKEQPAEEPAVAQPPSREVNVDHSNAARPASSSRSAGTQAAATAAEPAGIEAGTSVMPVEAAVQTSINRDVATNRASTRVDVEPAKAKAKAEVIEADASLTATTNVTQTSAAAAASTTATRDSSTVSTPAHVSQQVMQALAAYEADVPAGGSRSFQMLLDPPELGRLLVQMSRTSKGVDVRIAAENDSVRSILESSGQELQQGLQLSGFDLGQFSGSSSGGTFANGDEIVFAPSPQSFATSTGTATTSRTVTSVHASGAVNVVV